MAKNILEQIQKDLSFAATKWAKLHREIKDDFEFEQGKQWEDSDCATLRERGIKALAINKIKPIIKLITGLERQSRSDFKALPEGEEDDLTSEIATRLVKNIVKNSAVERKLSDQFKHGAIGGMCFIEPFIDYSFDLINGDLRFKKISPLDVFIDPAFQEYDLSDARFLIKISRGLSKDDLIVLFPDKESKINKIENGRLDWDTLTGQKEINQTFDYPAISSGTGIEQDTKEPVYDLIDYYYKELKTIYSVVSAEQGLVKDMDSKDDATLLANQIQGQVISRKVPSIMLAQVCGDQILFNDQVWTYPAWKSYPIIPFFAELITEAIDDFSLCIQGVVRGIKDLQEEYNKRRTQELAHLNTSANSGFEVEEGALSEDELAKLKKVGSSPGVVVIRKRGTNPMTRITPMPLSQGHAQLAEENAQDLKEASGVNPDLLANDSQSQSGRAILFKQRQGMVMVQEMLDNFSETKKMVGRFIITQLSELFTIESAMRVLGDAFIKDNFTVPVNIILERGLTKINDGKENEITELERATLLQYPQMASNQPIVDENNQLVTAVDFDTAIKTINDVLNNSELNKYDVAVGEGPFQDTIRMANFMDLKELAQQGVPIPPTVLIEQSMIPQTEKKQIMMQLQQQMMMQQQAVAQKQSSGGKLGEE